MQHPQLAGQWIVPVSAAWVVETEAKHFDLSEAVGPLAAPFRSLVSDAANDLLGGDS